MLITRKAIPRRTVLRGIGATLALPLLDAMVPSLTALQKTAATPITRFGVMYVPNGMVMEQWTPAADGAGFELTPTLAPLAPPAPVLAATGVASYVASADNGINVVYRWDFGDGTLSGWSNLPTATHTFASPGIYNVTVTANDDRGIQVTRTAVQGVYLPLAAQRPAASSSLAFETRATGNARLWVVNPDNDSVTVFDAVTNAKLAEVALSPAVGAAVGSDGAGMRAAGVDILTLGQYLRPTPNHLPIERWVTPEEFNTYREWALAKGFLECVSGPLVRSSYRAERALERNNAGLGGDRRSPDGAQ